MRHPALFHALLLTGAMLAALAVPSAARAQAWQLEHWTATWGASPAGPPQPANTLTFTDQTLRLVVHTSIGGNRVRIRLSNEMGGTLLRIGQADIAVRALGASIVPGTDRPLTFSGTSSITIAPGAAVLSDPVELNVAPLSDLAVSIYLPGSVQATTTHNTSQSSYVSQQGNYVGAYTLPVALTIASWPFLTAVDVDSAGAAIVTLGDSVTDGARTTLDTNSRWPDWLARRLQTVRDPVLGINGRLSVVNRGISGNRLLANAPQGSLAGRSALERFDRDVLATAGVRYMTVLIGIQDLGASPENAPVSQYDLIAGYRQLIARAHAKGIAVYGATLTPFEGSALYSPAREQVRQQINTWIRASDEFDGVIDFDQAMRDPVHGARLLPAYDSGDHLNPNDLGNQAMANAVPLTLFRSIGVQARTGSTTGK
ncbi:SGNH/GDSL hydrolase family protein [Massilia solisilvae]|uniref:SGNH/GDSL hydrolase family protein n=1 Tax=Massilia solisilvae TaxID=1811225 RepID=A0ABT2BFZ1_9BURK|nr:SGNH/GDSL hydrolase family protein [Massilia solisilvae]MCS0607434.1 SGNH/GDSL hydrolase family protein [Massilia solisilvae]